MIDRREFFGKVYVYPLCVSPFDHLDAITDKVKLEYYICLCAINYQLKVALNFFSIDQLVAVLSGSEKLK